MLSEADQKNDVNMAIANSEETIRNKALTLNNLRSEETLEYQLLIKGNSHQEKALGHGAKVVNIGQALDNMRKNMYCLHCGKRTV